MELEKKIQAFIDLGNELNKIPSHALTELKQEAIQANQWFTGDNIELAISGILRFLSPSELNTWIDNYKIANNKLLDVGIVMAGNIPLVGFHDLLCVIMSGNRAIVKTSSKDAILTKYVLELLIKQDPQLKDLIIFTKKLGKVDAVIATGSDNSARYFKHIFKVVPSLIRKNRTSIALLDGNETKSDLEKLGADIFQYFGLGCRNVSKLFVPQNYEFEELISCLHTYKPVINNKMYADNYKYNKVLSKIKEESFHDTGFLLVKSSHLLSSPISVLNYEEYGSRTGLFDKIKKHKDKIQCIVSNIEIPGKSVAFGKTQMPELGDYADNVDTMKFLTSLIK